MPPTAGERLTLAIETSNPSADTGAPGGPGPGVAVGLCRSDEQPRVLAIERLRPVGKHDDDLMPAIARCSLAAGITPRQIVRVAVSVGPGGFTALRIACAAAKMIAEAAGAKCISVPTALVIGARVDEQTRVAPFAVALAGKADTAHVTGFPAGGWRGPPVPTGAILGAPDLAGLGVRTLVADRFLPEPIRAQAAALAIRIVEPTFDPAACLELSGLLPEFDAVDLLPIYPRQPEAVTLWQQRSNRGGGGRKPL